eukprot:8311231-Alexandrium_andersonii.AAC.1
MVRPSGAAGACWTGQGIREPAAIAATGPGMTGAGATRAGASASMSRSGGRSWRSGRGASLAVGGPTGMVVGRRHRLTPGA